MTEQRPHWADIPEPKPSWLKDEEPDPNMDETDQLILDLTKKLEDQNEELSRTKALLQQREQELKEANETILELSESDLELNEARDMMASAEDKVKEANNTLTSADATFQAAKQEQKNYAATKKKIDEEKAAWDQTKQKQRDSIQALKDKHNKEFNERVKKKVSADVLKYKSVFFAFTLYGILMTVYAYIINGGMADIKAIISFITDNVEAEKYIIAALPFIIPVIMAVIGLVMMSKKKLEFLTMRTLYFTLGLLLIVGVVSGIVREYTDEWNFLALFFYVSAIRMLLIGLLGNEKTNTYY